MNVARQVSTLLREAEEDLKGRKMSHRLIQKHKAYPNTLQLDVYKMRATILAAALAHSRGRMHFQRVGHWWQYYLKAALAEQSVYSVPEGEEGFEWQRKTVLTNAKHFRHWRKASREGFERDERIISSEELSMVESLLDLGDARRSPRGEKVSQTGCGIGS